MVPVPLCFKAGCTNLGCRIAQATKFCTVAPNNCGSSIWNLFHVTRLSPRNLRLVPVFSSFLPENLYTPALRLTNAQAVKARVSIVTGYRMDARQQTRGVCAQINTLSSIGQFAIFNSLHRRRKKLLDDLKDRRGYSHLKEEALDRTMWRHRFGGGFGPVVRQNTE